VFALKQLSICYGFLGEKVFGTFKKQEPENGDCRGCSTECPPPEKKCQNKEGEL